MFPSWWRWWKLFCHIVYGMEAHTVTCRSLPSPGMEFSHCTRKSVSNKSLGEATTVMLVTARLAILLERAPHGLSLGVPRIPTEQKNSSHRLHSLKATGPHFIANVIILVEQDMHSSRFCSYRQSSWKQNSKEKTSSRWHTFTSSWMEGNELGRLKLEIIFTTCKEGTAKRGLSL